MPSGFPERATHLYVRMYRSVHPSGRAASRWRVDEWRNPVIGPEKAPWVCCGDGGIINPCEHRWFRFPLEAMEPVETKDGAE